MSCSAFASRSKARIRSSRENRCASCVSRSRSPSASSPSPARAGSTESIIMSRTTRDSSRHTSFRSWPDSTARSASANARGPVLLDHGVDQIEQQVAADQPEHGRHVVHGDRRGRRTRSPGRARSARRACCLRPRARSARAPRRTRRSSRHRRSCAAARRSPWSGWSGTRTPASATGSCPGILCSSVVAIMKTTCAGGSSIDLSSALNEGVESWWTSSMMKTL